MSIFPEISPTVLVITLLTITGGLLFILAGLGFNNPLIARMGLRNMLRRPSQVVLLLCGLALATIVTTATFGMSDSFDASAVSYRLAKMGAVDESASGPFTQAQIDRDLARLKQLPDVQAVTALGVYPRSPTVTSLRTGFSTSNVDFYATPPDFDAVFGSITNLQGQQIHFSDLAMDEVFLNPVLAQSLNAQTGDSVRLVFGDTVVTKKVRAILANDIAVTTGEVVGSTTPEVIMSLAAAQQIGNQPPDTLSIRNVGGTSQAAQTHSQAVLAVLQQLLPGVSASLDAPHALGVTDFDVFRIHPLQPDVAVRTAGLLLISKVVFLSSAGQQFTWLPPLFTSLLVGAGMLLLILLVILLAQERRAELGISRALGLQRSHLIQLFLFEGCGYGVLASCAGILLGIGATALELAIFSLQPTLAVGEANNSVPISVVSDGALHFSISWQSLVIAWCLGVLTTVVTVFITALWISRTNIVAAIRDLADPPVQSSSVATLWKACFAAPLDGTGMSIPETRARRRARRIGSLAQLFSVLCARGPILLLIGGLLLLSAAGVTWTQQLALVFLIAGFSRVVGWGLVLCKVERTLARRLSYSLMGLGWLALSIVGKNAFLSLFEPVLSFTAAPSAQELLLSMLLPVAGAVIVVMANADLLVFLIVSILQRPRSFVAVGRIGLIYPLTFRLRSGVTVTLLSLITFLVLLLVTTNLGAIQEAQATSNTGGFQLEVNVFGSQLDRADGTASTLQKLQGHTLLQQDFASVGLLRMMYDLAQTKTPPPIQLDQSGHPAYALSSPPMVADDAFLSTTTMPFFARAEGFASDRAVWDAVRDHPGYMVMQYDSQVAALPASTGFKPFTVELPDSFLSNAHYHSVTVIGLLPASTPWRVLLSERTAASIKQPPYIGFINTYLFRLQPAVSESQAAQVLNQVLNASSRGIAIQSLDQSSLNGISAFLTLFLSGYLALGLFFGALAIGVITSRSVVERRQQIGMLRALGFSRTLVSRLFLLESGFVILLSLLIGATLAIWLAFQIARATYHDFPFPTGSILLILGGSFLIVFVSTLWPAQRAARLHPAEALRYE